MREQHVGFFHMPPCEIDFLCHKTYENNLLSLNAPIAPPKATKREWDELNRSLKKAKAEKNIGQQITDIFEMIAYNNGLDVSDITTRFFTNPLHLTEIPNLIQELAKEPTLANMSVASLLWEEIKNEGSYHNGRTDRELSKFFTAGCAVTELALDCGMIGHANLYGTLVTEELEFRVNEKGSSQGCVLDNALRLMVKVSQRASKCGMSVLAYRAASCAASRSRKGTNFHAETLALQQSAEQACQWRCDPPPIHYKKLNRIAALAP